MSQEVMAFWMFFEEAFIGIDDAKEFHESVLKPNNTLLLVCKCTPLQTKIKPYRAT
ncbi:hypothetical protein ACU8KH_04197 [Lachancea thermotolerans]